MPTITDVVNAVVSVAAASKPAGYTVSYFPGFPVPEKLQAYLKSNKHQVSVFPYNVSRRVKAYVLNHDEQVISDVNGTATLITERSRQVRSIQIHVWATSPTAREAIGESLKLALDSIDFINLPDSQTGRILYVQEMEDDAEQSAGIYHRTYIYSVEYATTQKTTTTDACHPQILNEAGQVVNPGSNTTVLVNEIT